MTSLKINGIFDSSISGAPPGSLTLPKCPTICISSLKWSTELVTEELHALGFTQAKVTQMTNPRWKRPMPTVLVKLRLTKSGIYLLRPTYASRPWNLTPPSDSVTTVRSSVTLSPPVPLPPSSIGRVSASDPAKNRVPAPTLVNSIPRPSPRVRSSTAPCSGRATSSGQICPGANQDRHSDLYRCSDNFQPQRPLRLGLTFRFFQPPNDYLGCMNYIQILYPPNDQCDAAHFLIPNAKTPFFRNFIASPGWPPATFVV